MCVNVAKAEATTVLLPNTPETLIFSGLSMRAASFEQRMVGSACSADGRLPVVETNHAVIEACTSARKSEHVLLLFYTFHGLLTTNAGSCCLARAKLAKNT
jgi:hypothetical protein